MPITLGPGEVRERNVQLTPHVQPGELVLAASKDTYLDGAEPDLVRGSEDRLRIGWYGGEAPYGGAARALIQFSVPWQQIPAGATITEALVALHWFYQSDPPRTLDFARLRRLDWGENSATWRVYRSGSPWSRPGCGDSTSDYTLAGQVSVVADIRVPGPIICNILTQVQWARTYNRDVGIRVVDYNETLYTYLEVASRNHEVSSWRPTLTIKYQ